MDDVARANFQRHRSFDPGSNLRRRFRIGHGFGARERDAITGQEGGDLGWIEPFALVIERLANGPLRPPDVGLGTGRAGRRSLEQQVLALSIMNEIHECAHRPLRGFVIRHARGNELRAPLRDGRRPHPACEYVLLRRSGRLRQGVNEPLGRLRGRSDRGRTIGHQQSVDVRILHEDRDCIRVAVGVGIADDVDRIGVAPGRRQNRIELGDRVGSERRQPAAFLDQAVGGQHAGAAAVGDDCQAVAALRRHASQRCGRVEQFLDLVDAQHPGAPEGRFIHDIGSRQRAGMRGRGTRSFFRPSAFDHDHRLDASGTPRSRHEFARVRNRFGINQDRVGRLVEHEVIQEVAEIHVAHVAHRDDGREADPARQRPIEHRCRHRPRLRQERDIAGQHGSRRKRRIQPDTRHGNAEAVGTDDAQEMRARGRQKLRGCAPCRRQPRLRQSLPSERPRHAYRGFRVPSTSEGMISGGVAMTARSGVIGRLATSL